MDKIIQSLPNNMVVIICTVKCIDKYQDNYVINPQEVAFGKLDESNCFICERTEERLMDVSRFEEHCDDEECRYYLYPMSIEELKKKYSSKSTASELAISYFKEVRNNINIIYKTNTSEEPVIESIVKKDKESLRLLNERIEKDYHEKKVNVSTSEEKKSFNKELASIKRVDLANYLKERIINNDELMDDIATVIVANFRTNNPNLMKNIMCVGPTGCGKTKTFKLIAEYANIPVNEVDCNELTAEGYVGKSMDDVCRMIYSKAQGNLEKASRSILMFDEIDKLASRGDPIKDLDVQQALLKVLEGYKYSFENKRGSGQIQLDTSFITKVGSGAFMDLFDKRKQKHNLGFTAVEEKLEEKVLTDKDIIDYGFMPEFVGRFPLIYTYKPLDENGLKQLLTSSKISPLQLIKDRLNEEFGCVIEYDDDFLSEIVEEALKTQAGGRSLSKIIDQAFIKLEGAMIDEVDLGHEIPKTLKLKKEMIKDPHNFNL